MPKINILLLLLSLLFVTNSQSQSNKTIETVGDINQIAIPAAALVTTLILKDKKGMWDFAKSYGTTFVITRVLKKVIKKSRPDEPWSFSSFPSGHTSSAFSGASFIQRRYGWKYGAPAYVLAAFTGYSRVKVRRHYTIDVLAGAAIGIGSTYIFTTPYQKEHYQVTFSNKNDSYLVGFIYKF